MSKALRSATRIATLGVVLISTSVGANALTVGRCSVLVDGVYIPVLVVENDGQKTVHQIGEDGLTRRIVFNVNAALDWATQVYGVDEQSVSYSDKCHTSIEPPSPAGEAPPPDDGGGNDTVDGGGNDSVGGGEYGASIFDEPA